jgi:uridine kinase
MLIIGVAGGTGSGKTTLVQKVMANFPQGSIGLIAQDAYYNDNSALSFEERCTINYDHPSAIDFELLTSHLKTLKNGQGIAQPVYDFKTHNRVDQTQWTMPTKVLIVEGILIFSQLELRSIMDVKVFVEAPDDQRLIRRMGRDLTERGRDLDEVLARYQDTLKPMHDQFIAPSKKHADLVIPTHRPNSRAIDLLTSFIAQELNQSK